MSEPRKNYELSRAIYMLLVMLVSFILIISTVIVGAVSYEHYLADYYKPEPEETKVVASAAPNKEIVDGVDVRTGLVAEAGYKMVRANCTSCHSAKIITQNAQTREGWKGLIVWMQETQGLWDLGENEDLILDYLAANYAPEEKGRRAPLKDIEWYVLDVTKNQ